MTRQENTPAVDATFMDLFKLCVEMADRNSARRAGANTFFVSLHAVVASVVGYMTAKRTAEQPFDHFALVSLSIVGVTLSLTWWGILRYYRRLSKAKWDVINDMEKVLPVAPFSDEWKTLHPAVPPGAKEGWFKRNRHREATLVEQFVPLTFAAVYVALGARVLVP